NPDHQPVLGSFSGDLEENIHVTDDGRWLLIYLPTEPAGKGHTRLRLWRLPDGIEIPLTDAQAVLKSVLLSKKGTKIAALEEGGRFIHLWDARGDYKRITVPLDQIAIKVALSDNGRAIAFQTKQGGVGLWREGDQGPQLLRERLPSPSFNEVKYPPEDLNI